MRSPASLLIMLSMVSLGGCAADAPAGVATGALEEVITSECALTGAGTLGGDTLGGDVHDEGGVAVGSWSHGGGGTLEGTPTALLCRVNGSRVADVDGTGSWNGVPGHTFALHVQDRGTQTTERVPGAPGTVTITASRTYCPSDHDDGTAEWAEGADVTVPASIPVTVGNAGLGKVEVTFVEHESGEPIRCTYRSSSRGRSYALAYCERRDDEEGDGHRGRGRGHHAHGHGHGWGHDRHGCGDGWVVDASIVAGTVIEAASVEVHVHSGSPFHPTWRHGRTEVAAAFEVTPYVLETVGEPDFYRLVVWDAGGALVYTVAGDLTSGDLAVDLL